MEPKDQSQKAQQSQGDRRHRGVMGHPRVTRASELKVIDRFKRVPAATVRGRTTPSDNYEATLAEKRAGRPDKQ